MIDIKEDWQVWCTSFLFMKKGPGTRATSKAGKNVNEELTL